MLKLPQKPSDLSGRRVLVLGLGTKGGGVEVAKWLVAQGAKVTVTDQKPTSALTTSLKELRGLPIAYALGGHRKEDIRDADLVMRNPAVPLESPFLRLAEELQIPVVMDTSLFFLFCPAPIAGITGTRGKSTTTSVAAEIIRRSRPDTVLAGNIGRSPLADLETIRPDTPVVLELSSWQLEGLPVVQRSPHWAVLTTILQDHLNRYPSFEDYAASKEIIIRYQGGGDVAVLPADDPFGKKFAALAGERGVRVAWFGTQSEIEATPDDSTVLLRRGSEVILRRAGKEETLLAWNEVHGVGDHTKRNLVAGAILAIEMGASLDEARDVLRTFHGLPNRLQTAGEVQGRIFINDTTATTPEAVQAALGAFPDRKVVLLTGGTDKQLEYGALSKAMCAAPNLRAVILFEGSATAKLVAALQVMRCRWADAPRVRAMDAAVRQAWNISQPGDVILLSPGAASFELFQDEFDRGRQFVAVVLKLSSLPEQ